MTTRRRGRTSLWVALLLLLIGAIGTQVVIGGTFDQYSPTQEVQWVRSPAVMRRLVLGFDGIAADMYWIRAVQYYGSTRISQAEHKNYDFLYPLLDITTTLDPHFKIAYRFGAILLSEGYPNGPGKPDQAIALLEKGISQNPERWEYSHDAGFVEYWWRHDYESASRWLLKASAVPNAPNWLPAVAASMQAYGGNRETARALWSQLAETSEHDWMRQAARRGLMQLDAEAVIDELQPIANRFYDQANRFATGWDELMRAGIVRGIPLDPTGVPYALDPVSGAVDVAKESSLYPLRRGQ